MSKKRSINQVVAVLEGKKTSVQEELTAVHRSWKKELITGISRSYQPMNEDGDKLPSENKLVQLRVKDEISDIKEKLIDLFNLVATQEVGNAAAKASVVVGDKTLLPEIPVVMTLFLKRKLDDLRTFVQNIPTLPTDKDWKWDENRNCYIASEETIRTQKVPQVIVKYDATPEHPAQTEIVNVDKPVGTWTTVHMSGAITEASRDRMLERIDLLEDAVKYAREQANATEVEEQKAFGKLVLDFIFDEQR